MMLWFDEEFQKQFQDQSHLFDQMMALEGEVYRQLEARSTLRFEKNGHFYFIKKHYGVGWEEIFKNLLQLKQPVLGAKNEWLAIKKLTDLHVPTMKVMGYGCRGLNPAKQESFIITEELTQVESLEDLCADWLHHPPSFDFKVKLIQEVATMMRVLHENGVNHRDCYICHFLLDKSALKANEVKLYLIDLHRTQIRTKTPSRWKIKDIAGLYFSAMDIGLTKRDLYRFLKIYFASPLKDIFKKYGGFLKQVQKKARKLYIKHHAIEVEKIRDIEALREISYARQQPFSVMFHGESLICQRILRLLPDKRMVVLGSYQHQPVVAKLFFSKRAYQHHIREVSGSHLLNNAHIATPALLYSGESQIPGVFAVVFKYERTQVDVDSIWKGYDLKKLKDLLTTMQLMIAAQHDHGLYHADLHPNNFLMSDHGLLMLDVADIKGKLDGGALSVDLSIQNLSQFYAQLYLKHQDLILEIFKAYCHLRGWTYTVELEEKLLDALFKARYERIQNTVAYSLRQGSSTIKEQTARRFMLCRRDVYSSEMAAFLENPDYFIQQGEMLKDGRSCTVVKIKIGDCYFVVKRYNLKNIFHRLKKFWRESRAVKSWINAHVFDVLGILTAKPVACLEERLGWFRGRAYYVCEYVSGILLSDLMANESEEQLVKQYKIAENIAELFHLLKMANIFHGDMKATNIIIVGDRPYVLDLDAVTFYKNEKSYLVKHQKDIDRFMKNWDYQKSTQELFISLFK